MPGNGGRSQPAVQTGQFRRSRRPIHDHPQHLSRVPLRHLQPGRGALPTATTPRPRNTSNRAIKLAPQDAFSHSILGIALYQQGKYDEAVKILSRATALDPNDPKTRNYLGIAASQKGWQEAAEQECRKAIEIDPQYGGRPFQPLRHLRHAETPGPRAGRRHYNRALELGVPRDPQLESLIR
ncbi:MAG: tetratricopeptide repeat protein [Bdellovibrionaceae bacterium]|nr:tetratricopeptide repeat protein [Pseudobdellovibrionaceae bacterium]